MGKEKGAGTTREASEVTAGMHLRGIVFIVSALSSVGFVHLLPSRSVDVIDVPFLELTDDPIIVAFAGFPECGTVCPVSLALLREVYQQVAVEKGLSLGVKFINIELNTPQNISEQYAKSFHPRFQAYSVRSQDAENLYKHLAIRTFDDRKGAADHSGYIFVFALDEDGWRVQRVFRRTPSVEEVVAQIVRTASRISNKL